jgi:hypothetical protein
MNKHFKLENLRFKQVIRHINPGVECRLCVEPISMVVLDRYPIIIRLKDSLLMIQFNYRFKQTFLEKKLNLAAYNKT